MGDAHFGQSVARVEDGDGALLGYVVELRDRTQQVHVEVELGHVVEALEKATNAKRRGLTYVIELNAWSENAKKSALIANTFAEIYVAEQIAAKTNATTKANEWLTKRVEEMRIRVTAADTALEKYKAEQSLFDPGGDLSPV